MIYPVAVIVIAARSSRSILWKVIPTFADAVRRPRRRAAAADPHRHRDAATASWRLCRCADRGRHRRPACRASGATTRPTAAAASIDAHRAEAAGASACMLRKIAVGAVLPHALDADRLGRADPRRPRDHRAAPPGNAIIEDAIMATREGIERGETIAGTAARRPRCSRRWSSQMINVGETTGALDAMLSKIADFYEEEVDTGGRRPADAARAGHDRRSWNRHRRRHRHLDGYAGNLRAHREAHVEVLRAPELAPVWHPACTSRNPAYLGAPRGRAAACSARHSSPTDSGGGWCG